LTHFRLEQVADGAWAAIADSDLAAGNAGHGEVGGRSDLDDFRAHLADIMAAAEEHGASAPIPARYRDWSFEGGWARNLAFLTCRR
jgi:hypothetical protein